MSAEKAGAVAGAQARWRKEQPQRLGQSLGLTDALIDALAPVLELAQRYEIASGDRTVPALVRFLAIELERARALALAEAQAAFAETDGGREAGVERVVGLLSDAAALRLRMGAALVTGNLGALTPHVPSSRGDDKADVPEAETRLWVSALVGERKVLDSPADAFEKVKAWAQDSFPMSPTDVDILTNSATPDLMRYLLDALRAYDGKPQNLPTAFGIRRKGKRGNPGAVKTHGVEIERAARFARDEAVKAGKTSQDAMAIAVSAGFEQLRVSSGNDPDPTGSKQKKRDKQTRDQIRELLGRAWG